MIPKTYDIAQICLSGHLINCFSDGQIDRNTDFCETCGEKTITRCPTCESPIRGGTVAPQISSLMKAPSYCIFCGSSFPWLAARLAAAEELADIVDEFTADDKRVIANSLKDIVRDTARTQVAALKFKGLAAKAGGNIATAFRDILVEVASETAKKTIWPGS
jgi:hypothetical protein